MQFSLEIECPFENYLCVTETSRKRIDSSLPIILATRWRSSVNLAKAGSRSWALPKLTQQPKQVISTSCVRRPNVEPWIVWTLSPLGRLRMLWILVRRHCSGNLQIYEQLEATCASRCGYRMHQSAISPAKSIMLSGPIP